VCLWFVVTVICAVVSIKFEKHPYLSFVKIGCQLDKVCDGKKKE